MTGILVHMVQVSDTPPQHFAQALARRPAADLVSAVEGGQVPLALVLRLVTDFQRSTFARDQPVAAQVRVF